MEGLHNISVVDRWAILKIDLAVFKILSHKNSMLLEVGEDEDGYYGNDPLFGNGGHHHHLCTLLFLFSRVALCYRDALFDVLVISVLSVGRRQ